MTRDSYISPHSHLCLLSPISRPSLYLSLSFLYFSFPSILPPLSPSNFVMSLVLFVLHVTTRSFCPKTLPGTSYRRTTSSASLRTFSSPPPSNGRHSTLTPTPANVVALFLLLLLYLSPPQCKTGLWIFNFLCCLLDGFLSVWSLEFCPVLNISLDTMN